MGKKKWSGTNGNDYLTGGSDDDIFLVSNGNDTIDGGAGNNTVDYSGAFSVFLGFFQGSVQVTLDWLEVNLYKGTAGMAFHMPGQQSYETVQKDDILRNIQNVLGSPGWDALTGNDENNRLYGNGGRDWLNYSGGNDLLDGGDEVDIVDYSGLASKAPALYSVNVNLSSGYANKTYVAGGNGTDKLVNIEAVYASDGNDVIEGNDADNELHGMKGSDLFFATKGNDNLWGDESTESINLADINTADYSRSGLAYINVNLVVGKWKNIGFDFGYLDYGKVEKYLVADHQSMQAP